jgi:hypothetical protein
MKEARSNVRLFCFLKRPPASPEVYAPLNFRIHPGQRGINPYVNKIFFIRRLTIPPLAGVAPKETGVDVFKK